jgi:SpoVK/Ycf46/Vps4 family AAA+-type ATPase
VFVVTTSNNISALPPEFSRAERFDAVYFLDLPSEAERQAIWRIYLAKFAIPNQPLPEDVDWTGAEIRSCCRLASLLDASLLEAARNVVPVAATAAESVERLRTWACGRCLSANTPGLYTRARPASVQVKRRVSRPANN